MSLHFEDYSIGNVPAQLEDSIFINVFKIKSESDRIFSFFHHL